MNELLKVVVGALVGFFLVGLPAWPQIATADDAKVSSARVNVALERLAVALSYAVDDPLVHTFLRDKLGALGDVPLTSLVTQSLEDGSPFATRLVEGYRRSNAAEGTDVPIDKAITAIFSILETLPGVDLAMSVDFDVWDPQAQSLQVAFVEEGALGGDISIRIFDSTGQRHVRPLHDVGELEGPVLALELHDSSEADLLTMATKQEAGNRLSDSMTKVGGQCSAWSEYESYPLISRAKVFDIHEGWPNGEEGFAYFTAAGGAKRGTPPASLGGRTGWTRNAYSSNFQGPVYIFSGRIQWEWTAEGWWQSSTRTYPATFCRQKVSNPGNFSAVNYTVKEHDERGTTDDYVGKVRIDHRYCKSEVFDKGKTAAWSNIHWSPRFDDIKDVRYELYCTKKQNYTCSMLCRNGNYLSCTGSGSCSGCEIGSDWISCNGLDLECGPGGP